MKILFVCKHNKFRSKVAEAIFNKLNKDKKIIAESAGLVGSEHKTPDSVVKVLKKRGYRVAGMDARKVGSIRIKDYDILVIVASNIDPEFFKDSYRGKIIWWKITDCDEMDITGIKERVDEIEKKIKKLVEKS